MCNLYIRATQIPRPVIFPHSSSPSTSPSLIAIYNTGAKREEKCWLVNSYCFGRLEVCESWVTAPQVSSLKHPGKTFREEYQCSPVVLLFYLSYTHKPSEKADEYCLTNSSRVFWGSLWKGLLTWKEDCATWGWPPEQEPPEAGHQSSWASTAV